MAEYIDKNELREYISGYVKSCNGKPTYTDMDAMVGIISLLELMPAADVQPEKHGHWIEVSAKHSKCSICDTTCLIAVYPISKNANYCPNCGARMDEQEVEKDA